MPKYNDGGGGANPGGNGTPSGGPGAPTGPGGNSLISIDPATLRWAGNHLLGPGGPAEILTDLARETEVELLVIGDAWGAGEIADGYTEVYFELRDGLLKGTNNIGLGLNRTGLSVNDAALAYESTEIDNVG